MESCAFPEFTVKPDAPTLHLNQALGNVESKTCTRDFTRLRIIGPEEALEDLRLIFDADANSVILHPEMDDAFRAFGLVRTEIDRR